MQNPVGWFEIYVADMSRAQAFYQSVLAVQLEDMTDPTDDTVQMKGFPSNMEQYGSSGALVYTKGVPVGQNSVVVYFSCEDCAVEAARVETSGGNVEKDKFSIGDYGFIVIAKDTEGNVFGLHSLK